MGLPGKPDQKTTGSTSFKAIPGQAFRGTSRLELIHLEQSNDPEDLKMFRKLS